MSDAPGIIAGMRTQPCEDSHEVSILTIKDTAARAMVLPESAVVSCATCFPRSQERILVDLEGDKYGTAKTVFDKVVHATGRHMTRYPTVARLFLKTEDTVEVGSFRMSTGAVLIEDPVAFAQWYGVPAEDLVQRARLDHLERSLRTVARRPPRTPGEMLAYERDMAEFTELSARVKVRS